MYQPIRSRCMCFLPCSCLLWKLARWRPVYEPHRLSVVVGVPEYGYMCEMTMLCNVSFICVFYFSMRARRFARRVNFPSRSSCFIIGINLSWAGNTSHVNEGMQHVHTIHPYISNVCILVENIKPVVAVCCSTLFKWYLGLCNLRDKLSI